MKKILPFQYEVDQGEKVLIEIVRMEVNTTPRAALDGESIAVKTDGNKKVASFTVTKDPLRTHRLKFWFEFPPQTADTAFFELTVVSEDGKRFKVPRIMEPGNIEEFNFATASFRFVVAK